VVCSVPPRPSGEAPRHARPPASRHKLTARHLRRYHASTMPLAFYRHEPPTHRPAGIALSVTVTEATVVRTPWRQSTAVPEVEPEEEKARTENILRPEAGRQRRRQKRRDRLSQQRRVVVACEGGTTVTPLRRQTAIAHSRNKAAMSPPTAQH